MYSGVECLVCCYSECIYHTRQAENQPDHGPKISPTVVRLIFRLAWCGIYTQSNNTLNETQNAVSASGTKESKRSKKSSNEVKDPAISVPPCQGENEKGKKNEKANRKNNMPFDKEMPAEKGTEKKVEIETAELVHKKSKKSKKNKK